MRFAVRRARWLGSRLRVDPARDGRSFREAGQEVPQGGSELFRPIALHVVARSLDACPSAVAEATRELPCPLVCEHLTERATYYEHGTLHEREVCPKQLGPLTQMSQVRRTSSWIPLPRPVPRLGSPQVVHKAHAEDVLIAPWIERLGACDEVLDRIELGWQRHELPYSGARPRVGTDVDHRERCY